MTFPGQQRIAEAGAESRPRVRAPLRGQRALTPPLVPRQIIQLSGECHKRMQKTKSVR
jgi:hypothetical protein